MRREMVGLFQKQGLSHRQACRLTGISRSVDKYSTSEQNQPLLERMKALAFEHIHYGYRRIWALLKREGWTVSLNRVKRLWKLNHLQVPKRKPKQRRRGPCVQQYPAQAIAPNHVWSLDFVADRLGHGGRIRMLTLVDEFTRECLAISVKRSQKAVDVQEALAQVMKERGHPCYLRSDNGSEFIEKSLQKWLKEKVLPLFLLTLVAPGRMGNANHSMGSYEANASMPLILGRSEKPKCSLKCGGKNTTPSALTEL